MPTNWTKDEEKLLSSIATVDAQIKPLNRLRDSLMKRLVKLLQQRQSKRQK